MMRVYKNIIIGLLLLMHIQATAASGVDFSYPDLDGKLHRLSDYRGKWVVVNYWATWCPPCLEELPELEVFHNSHKDRDALVLGLNMEDIEVGRLRAFVREHSLSYPVLQVGGRPEEVLGAVPGLPTTFLVTPDGEVVARQIGFIDGKSIESFIANYKNAGGENP
ncbi:TlpA disulfide reductase family protein [Thiolapillus sp.]